MLELLELRTSHLFPMKIDIQMPKMLMAGATGTRTILIAKGVDPLKALRGRAGYRRSVASVHLRSREKVKKILMTIKAQVTV